jgi:hypothetical protein
VYAAAFIALGGENSGRETARDDAREEEEAHGAAFIEEHSARVALGASDELLEGLQRAVEKKP